MSGMYGYNREAVRVKVKKCEKNLPPETRKFSVDPQITSLEVLYSILAKAFDLKADFGISCKTVDPNGQETYLVVLSDWDLDAAFLRAHNHSIATKSESCLYLRVDIKPFSEASEWDGNAGATSSIPRELVSLQQSIGAGQKYVQNKLPGLIMNQMEKTLSMVQRALNLVEDPLMTQTIRPPLSDAEFRTFLDSVGQIVAPEQLRKVIYLGGIDPSLRRVVWKHILNVYPDGMTGKERMEYMKKKSGEYYRLREVWRNAIQQGNIAGELAYVTSMVRKDVLRTDRLHPFYAGSDDNQNIAALFHVLTTYALNHPAVSYCQGMSDIASPLLVTMGDEAQAYICFCAIMTRLSCNFMLDGIAMTLKFSHLSEALQYYDPDFFGYLKSHQADDLLFCYRWLLLEMKREFAFEDALRMLEVLWSSLPPMAPNSELALFEKEFEPPPMDVPLPKSPAVVLRTPRENPYTKVCALRRQSSALSLSSSYASTNPRSVHIGPGGKLDATRRLNLSLDENITRENFYTSRNFGKVHQSLDEAKIALVKQRKIVRSVGDDDNIEEVQQLQEDADNATDIDDNVFQSPQHAIRTNPFIDSSPEKTTPTMEQADMETETETETVEAIESTSSPVTVQQTQVVNSAESSVRNSPIARSKSLFSSGTGNLIARQLSNQKKNFSSGAGGGHFKELKEKLAASKKGIFASLDRSDSSVSSNAASGSADESSRKPKLVKNFNEFLNFATMNKSRISDRLATRKITSSMESTTSSHTTVTTTAGSREDSTDTIEYNELKAKPVIKLTKSSFDDSDSSSIGVADSTTTALSRSSDYSSIVVDDSSVSASPIHQPMNRFQMQLVVGDNRKVGNHNDSESTTEGQPPGGDGSSPDDSQEYFPMTTSMTRELRLELENLDRHVFGPDFHTQQRHFYTLSGCIDLETPPESGDSIKSFEPKTGLSDLRKREVISYSKLLDNGTADALEIQSMDEICDLKEPSPEVETDVVRYREKSRRPTSSATDRDSKRISTSSANASDVFVWENPLHQCESPGSTGAGELLTQIRAGQERTATTPDEHPELEYDGEIIEETTLGKKSVTPIRLVRKNGERSIPNSNRNSMILADSDSSDDSPPHNRSPAVKFKFHPNNPFFDAGSTTISTGSVAIERDLMNAPPVGPGNRFDEVPEASVENFTLPEQQMLPSGSRSVAGQTVAAIDRQSPLETHLNIASEQGIKVAGVLPSPQEFGGGNPFLMFLCLTILLQHRDYIMKTAMDYNEMAMHFDKMVRKHNVTRVLNQARQMYAEYRRLYQQQQKLNHAVSVVPSAVDGNGTDVGHPMTGPGRRNPSAGNLALVT